MLNSLSHPSSLTFCGHIYIIYLHILLERVISLCYYMQEEADIYTGHILLYGALIRSGLLFKGTAEEQTEVFNRAIEAGSKRSYLVLPSHTLLIILLNKVTMH